MILISPYSKPMRNGELNPKNYPYWNELVKIMLVYTRSYAMQVGTKGEPKLDAVEFETFSIKDLAKKSCNENSNHLILCVDNFMQHMCHYYGKKCVVLWGQSDPLLFGYKENINLLKDRKYLRPNQFDTWENCKFNADAFLSAEEVFNQIKHLL